MKEMRFFAALMLLGVMFVSCASHASERGFGPYSAAEAFYKKANYPKAIEKYQEYLTNEVEHFEHFEHFVEHFFFFLLRVPWLAHLRELHPCQ